MERWLRSSSTPTSTRRTSDFEVFDKAVDDPARRHMIGVKDAQRRRARRRFGPTRSSSAIHASTSATATSRRRVSLGFHNDIVLSVGPTSKSISPTSRRSASLKLAGKATLGAEMKGKFNDPVLTGDLAVPDSRCDDFPLGDISSSKVSFRPLTVDFSEIHAKKGKSSFDVPTARLDFNGPATLVADAVGRRIRSLRARFLAHVALRYRSSLRPNRRARPHQSRPCTTSSAARPIAAATAISRCAAAPTWSSMDLFGEHYDSLDSDFTYNWLDRDAADLGLDVDIRSMTLRRGAAPFSDRAPSDAAESCARSWWPTTCPSRACRPWARLGKLLEGSASAVGTIERHHRPARSRHRRQDVSVACGRLGAARIEAARRSGAGEEGHQGLAPDALRTSR